MHLGCCDMRSGFESIVSNLKEDNQTRLAHIKFFEDATAAIELHNISLAGYCEFGLRLIFSVANPGSASAQDQFSFEIIPTAVSSTEFADDTEDLGIGSVQGVRLTNYSRRKRRGRKLFLAYFHNPDTGPYSRFGSGNSSGQLSTTAWR